MSGVIKSEIMTTDHERNERLVGLIGLDELVRLCNSMIVVLLPIIEMQHHNVLRAII